jgi:hypothetical protein
MASETDPLCCPRCGAAGACPSPELREDLRRSLMGEFQARAAEVGDARPDQ